MTTRKPSQRYFRALALEPRILLDAAAVTTAAEVAAQVDAPATDTAPGIDVTPTKSSVTITDTNDVFPVQIPLFQSADVSLDGTAQKIKEFVISVNTSGSNQALVLDGKQLTLTANADEEPFTDTGYQYKVNVTGGTTTITLNFDADDGISAEAAEQLLNGLRYQVLDKSVDSGTVKVTLNSLEDTGGQKITLDASATIIIDNQINVAPVLENDGALDARETFTPEELGIGNAAEVAYSADGKYAYVAGTNGIQAFSVDGSGVLTALQSFTNNNLGSVTHLAASADGTSLYTVSGNTNIVHLSLGVDGKISAATITPTGNGEARSLAISDDSQYVYVGTSSNDVAIYVRDAATGGLSHLDVNGNGRPERAPGEGGSNTRNGVVFTSGNHVYVAYGHVSGRMLFVYQRNGDGTLSTQASYTFSAGSNSAVDYSIAASDDGQYIYVGDPENNVIRVFRVNDGQLAPIETISQNRITSVALGNDGKTLYSSASDGTLNTYAVAANGTLGLTSSVSTNTSGSDIAIAADGSVLVAGGNLTRYTGVQSLNLGQPTAFAEGLTLKDSNYDALNNGAGNYKSASLTFSSDTTGGNFGFANVGNLTQSGTTVSLNDTAIASFNVDANGKLTIAFTADTSKAVANQVLQQITYTSAVGAVAGSLVTLTVQGSDGILASNALTVLLRANEAPKVNPGAPATLSPVTTETGYSFVLPANLFTDTSNDKLTWTLTGLPAGLSFDPATRTISGTTTEIGTFELTITVTDTSGLSATRELDIVVEQIDNRAPEVSANAPATLPSVVVGTDGYSQILPAEIFQDADAVYGDSTLTWSVDELPSGVTFDATSRTLSGTPTVVGNYSVAIKVTDEHGATAEHTVILRVISPAEADNNPPSVSAEDSALIYTPDGRINGYDSAVYSIEVSSDGRTVIVLGNGSTQHALNPTGNSTLTVYSRDLATGVLTEIQRFVQGASNDGNDANGIEVDGLVVSASATYSADGKHLYLVGQKAGGGAYVLTAFTVSTDGTLNPTGESAELGSTAVKYITTTLDGHIYAVAGNTLYAFTIAADGALGSAATYVDQPFGGTGYAIATDADSRVFVTGTNSLAIYERGTDGALIRVASHVGNIGNFVRTIAVSDNGYVYISTGSPGSILTFHYDAAQKTLGASSSLSASQVWGLQLSADGKTLYAGNNTGQMHVYSIGDNGKPTFVKTIGNNGASGDYRVLRIAVSPDGSSMYVGSFYNFKGLGHIAIENAISVPYVEGQTITLAAGLTLSDADYDVLNSNAGNYNGATITLQREGDANPDDRFSLGIGNGLTLQGDEIRLDNAKIADFTEVDGKLTVLFTADVSTAIANAVLQQIAYSNDSQEPAANIRLKLLVQDQYQSGTSSIALVLSVTSVNDAPEVTATPGTNLSHDAGYTAPVALFGDVQVSVVEQSQFVSGLTFSVSGLKDGAAEILSLDGTSIALVAGSGTTNNGHAWTVTLNAETGIATVTLSSQEGLSEAAASALITGLTYANSDKVNGTSGERTVTLTSVKDNGGTANGGQDTATLALSATVTVRGDLSPSLGADLGAAELAELITSSDYPNPYDGLNGVVQVGNLVYAVRSGTAPDPDTGNDVPVSTLYVFQRGQDGTLSLLSSIESNAQNGLLSATSLNLSADGRTLYALTDNGIALFGRDSSTGALTAQGLIAGDLGLINDVQIHGDVAYTSSFNGITLFHRGADGWTTGTTITAPGDSAFSDLQLSADNAYLFAATTGGNTLLSVIAVNADGSLGTPQAFDAGQTEHFADRLTLSADGKTLYVADSNNLYTLSVAANGALQLVGAAVQLDAPAKQLLVSNDGSLLIVVSEEQIALYGRAANGALSEGTVMRGAGDANEWGEQTVGFQAVRSAALSADGSQLYLSGTFSWSDGLLVLDLKPLAATFTENGQAVALLPGGTLADPQLDALAAGAGNYQGASLVVSRDGSVNPDDVFTFINSPDLEMRDNAIWLNNVNIASVDNTGGTLTIRFTSSVSQADAQRVLRSMAYSNSSNDPTAAGDKAAFTIILNDGDGYNSERLVEVILVGVNDPAIVTTNALTPTFNAEGERVPLFQDTTIDTVEAGQNIQFIEITITGVKPGDVLGVDGGKLPIAQDQNAQLFIGQSAIEYRVTYNEQTGTATVMLYVARSAERTAEVIDGLTYGHTGDETSGQRSISLVVGESGSGDTTTEVTAQALVTIAEATTTNTPPTLGNLPSAVPYTEQAAPVLIAANATLGDAQLDRFNGGMGNYDGATLTIRLGDGKSSSDVLGFKDGNGLTLEGSSLQRDGKVIGTVTVADGVMSITFTDAVNPPTTQDVQNTLRQITYANTGDAPPARVEVSIVLADQRDLQVSESVAIDITAVNDAPGISDDPVLSLGDLENLQTLTNIPGLGVPTRSEVASDGSRVYVADAQGNIALFNRDTNTGELTHVQTLPGQMGIVQLQLTADGSQLYVLQSDGSASSVIRFTAAADGTLQRQESIAGPFNVLAMSLAEDGKNLYLIDRFDSGITTYSRDAATGQLTLLNTIVGDSSTAPFLWATVEVVATANHVIVARDTGIIVYTRDANGALTPLAHLLSAGVDSQGQPFSLGNIQHMAVSADGKTIFVANGWTTRTEGGGWTFEPEVTIRENNPQRIDAFTLDTNTGTFTHFGTLTDVPAVESIALSEDGKALFVSRHDGSLAYYSAASLVQMGSAQTGLVGADRIALSADGAVIVTGNSLYVLATPAIPAPTTVIGGDAVALVPAMTLNDAELDAANDYQGASVTINGEDGDRFSMLANATYSLDGQRILSDGNEVATLIQTGNSALLRFTAAISQSNATALLRLISYSSETGALGSHSISLILNDGDINSQARSVEVTLLAPNQPPSVNDAHSDYALSDAKAGQAYSITLPADLFRDPEGDSLTWSAAGLPAGLSFNGDTHAISGTSTVIGEYTVTITVRDASGGSVSLQLTLDVSNSEPVANEQFSLGNVTPGQAYEVTLPESLFSDANDSELTWEIVELPEWLSYDPITRTLSGIAPNVVGSHAITITATDSHGATVSHTLTLAVALPPVQNAGDTVLPELATGFQQTANTPAAASFGGPALNAPLFESSDVAANDALQAPAPAQRSASTQNLLRSTGSGLADGRGSLSEQLANADGVLTDSGQQNTASSFSFDGPALRSSVDLSQNAGSRSIELRLPVELPDGSSAQRVTLANGLPLPSWASFDARTGELRIDRERLQRDGALRLTLISRDAEGKEQRMPVEVRAAQAPSNAEREAPQKPTAQVESLPQRLQQETSSAVLSEAFDLLDQLSDLAGEPVVITTRHSA